MSEHDDEQELYEEVAPRSIFAATWFRVLLVLIVIGVVGAVASSYVLDFMNPPPSRPTTAAKPPSPPAAIPVPPAASSAMAEKPAVDKVDSLAAPPPTGPIETTPTAPKPPKAAAVPSDKTKTTMAVIEPTPPRPAAPTAKPVAKPAAAPKPDAAARDTVAGDPAAKDMSAPDTATKDAPKTDVVAKADTKPEMVAKADPKPAIAAKPAVTPKRAAAVATTPAPKPSTASGPFWVQVGAFKDADAAKRLAAKLRGDNFNVEESVTKTRAAATSTPKTAAAPAPKTADAASEQYDVFVSGLTPEELNSKLAAKGLAAEASGGGMVVKPSLPLRDAVALSKDLAVEGFKVQVRRAGSSMSAAATPTAPAGSAPATGESGSELHRVRVGAFADRAAAQEAMRQLEAKGYKPYIARGDQ